MIYGSSHKVYWPELNIKIHNLIRCLSRTRVTFRDTPATPDTSRRSTLSRDTGLPRRLFPVSHAKTFNLCRVLWLHRWSQERRYFRTNCRPHFSGFARRHFPRGPRHAAPPQVQHHHEERVRRPLQEEARDRRPNGRRRAPLAPLCQSKPAPPTDFNKSLSRQRASMLSSELRTPRLRTPASRALLRRSRLASPPRRSRRL